jgi:uncharacterized protein YprB with RNaseH-like and TPR domain
MLESASGPNERADTPVSPMTPSPPARAPSPALLDELRARTRRILERTATLEPRPLPSVDTDDLPFASCQSASGLLHVRARRLSAAHRIGRTPVAAGRHASAELLALLALEPALAACDVERALYLDIEIAKVADGARTVAFLVGLAWWDEGTLVLEQLLVRGLAEEEAMLARLRDRLEAASMVVTFNGKAFDAPILRERFALATMPGPSWPPHLDLLHIARRVHGSRTLEESGPERERVSAERRGCRLITVEQEVLGFGREADVPSGRVSACYRHFLRTGEAGALLAVVDHNAWDVVAMVALVGLYGDPLHEALPGNDVVGIARTLRRAGALDRAAAAAELAVQRAASAEALRARADIAKARREWSRAARDLESLAGATASASVFLELAKLYEHRLREPARALAWARRGTGEDPERLAARVSRLLRKASKGTAGAVTPERAAPSTTRARPRRREALAGAPRGRGSR